VSHRLLKTRRAKRDLAEAAARIAADNLNVALRFLSAAERDCAFLAKTPGAGAKRDFLRKDLAEVRSSPIGGFKNYLIFYRPTPAGIEVLRVLHGARDIGSLLDKQGDSRMKGDTMNRNIEIKARATNLADLLDRAKKLADAPPQVLLQEDVFFHTPNGRLKLRTINGTQSELIYYERPDGTQPKDSQYLLLAVSDPQTARELLGRAYGIRGIVRKRRTLFLVGVTRIHIDEVEGLGEFVELEVVLPADWSAEAGVKIAKELMRKLNIEESTLVADAYMDLLDPHLPA